MAAPEMAGRARRLHERGLSWAKVGQRLGVSAATAWRWGTKVPTGGGEAREPTEAERVRERLVNGRLRRVRVTKDGAGRSHQLGLVRIPGGLELVVDRPEQSGAVRCLAVLSAEENLGQARAICADYAKRIAREERPICRAVRLRELVEEGEDS